MSNDMTGTNDIDIDTIVDNRTALYDQLEAQPYRLLQEEVTELITNTVEAAGRDASDVEKALLSDPLDEDWWFSISTQQALNAIVVTGDEGVIRVDITYELGDERDLTVPSPDALPILNNGDELTIYCLLDRDIDLSTTTGNVEIEGVSLKEDSESKPEPKSESEPEPTPPPKNDRSGQQDEKDGRDGGSTGTGPVTVSLIGPEGQKETVDLPRDRTMGFVVADLKQSYDVHDAEIGLYEDKQYSTAIDDNIDPGQYEEETVYWRVERRAA
ncbi:hypothetical protein [Halorientalis regularis]|uniref:Uncharacterized protein n=1 Tax=Halorientalis regularis TaxID=660518 RepID=A0A1G7R9T9_9EURY|nr:hypothetical protein [Halorientalis regularis]SDG07493.1 hypothetical protein SAMN05216218_114115 [Halorientalis regularis]